MMSGNGSIRGASINARHNITFKVGKIQVKIGQIRGKIELLYIQL